MNERLIDHQQAVNNMMAERYLLGELNEGERNAFEGHFFECSECFDQVKAGTEFISSLKKVGTEETVAVPPGWRPAMGQWFRPKSAQILGLMFLGLASFSVYQGILIRHAAAPLAAAPEIVSVQTIHLGARSGGTEIAARKPGAFELLVFFPSDVPPGSGRIQITDEAGREISSVFINDLHQRELQIRFPTGKFHTGKYLLALKAIDQASGGEKVLNQYPFAITIKE